MYSVRKEALIAVFIGCLLGLIITFGIRRANSALNQAGQSDLQTADENTSSSDSDTPTSVPSPNQEVKSILTISSPDNNSLTDQNKVTITGTTTPSATVVISDSEADQITTSDAKGNFSQDITLSGGPNQISIYSFDAQGNQTTKTLNIVYSTAQI
jgi:hypothetical protein